MAISSSRIANQWAIAVEIKYERRNRLVAMEIEMETECYLTQWRQEEPVGMEVIIDN